MDSTFAQQLRQWRQDISLMPPNSRAATQIRCYAYNWATNPAAMRGDREHKACSTFARLLRRALAGMTGWHECENGRYWC